MPLKYRRVGEQEWHAGVAENISQTGIFFRGDRGLTEQEVIEINFSLRAVSAPEGSGSARSSPQPCTAIIIRTDRSRAGNKPGFGTRFLD
ncbi:MAG: PilZ domain-containing protein [Acidobacteriota bacterium]|nr:PilZ domain-containing protein [Acidobacteriota bacterium]